MTCTKQGYVGAVGRVGSNFQRMTFGNTLFGGIVGIAVDAVSGATAEYEANVAIRPAPTEFPGIEARDRFIGQQRETFVTQTRQVRERISRRCSPPDCDRQLQLTEDEETTAFARIEARRQSARIKAE